jgi:hypothetical protein
MQAIKRSSPMFHGIKRPRERRERRNPRIPMLTCLLLCFNSLQGKSPKEDELTASSTTNLTPPGEISHFPKYQNRYVESHVNVFAGMLPPWTQIPSLFLLPPLLLTLLSSLLLTKLLMVLEPLDTLEGPGLQTLPWNWRTQLRNKKGVVPVGDLYPILLSSLG